MKKYLHTVLFPLLLSILWILSIEYFHVFQGQSRAYHWTLVFPLMFFLWTAGRFPYFTQDCRERRVMFRALTYMFFHHSKELMWHEVFECLEKRHSDVICLLNPEYKACDSSRKWKPLWVDNDKNLVDITNATRLACQQMVSYYMAEHATMEQKKIYRRWKSGGASDIYIVASFLNVM